MVTSWHSCQVHFFYRNLNTCALIVSPILSSIVFLTPVVNYFVRTINYEPPYWMQSTFLSLPLPEIRMFSFAPVLSLKAVKSLLVFCPNVRGSVTYNSLTKQPVSYFAWGSQWPFLSPYPVLISIISRCLLYRAARCEANVGGRVAFAISNWI